MWQKQDATGVNQYFTQVFKDNKALQQADGTSNAAEVEYGATIVTGIAKNKSAVFANF